MLVLIRAYSDCCGFTRGLCYVFNILMFHRRSFPCSTALSHVVVILSEYYHWYVDSFDVGPAYISGVCICQCLFVPSSWRYVLTSNTKLSVLFTDAWTALFNGSMWTRLDFSRPLKSHSDDLYLRFRSPQKDGLLFETAATGSNTFLRGSLENGRVKVETNLGGEQKVRRSFGGGGGGGV